MQELLFVALTGEPGDGRGGGERDRALGDVGQDRSVQRQLLLVERELLVDTDELEGQLQPVERSVAPFVAVDVKQPGVLLGEQVEPGVAGLIGERFVVNHIVDREALVERQVGIVPRLDERQHGAVGVKLQVVEMGVADQEGHPRELLDRPFKLEPDFPAAVIDAHDRLDLGVDGAGLENRDERIVRIGQDEAAALVKRQFRYPVVKPGLHKRGCGQGMRFLVRDKQARQLVEDLFLELLNLIVDLVSLIGESGHE